MKTFATLLLAGTMLAWSLPAKADPIVELGLAIDTSGSIGTANFNLQKQAYLNVLNNVAILPQDGSVAVGVISFSSTIRQIFPTTVITAATIGNLISAIQVNLIYTQGGTAIGDAIANLSAQLLGNAITSTRQVIDVSTDGDGTSGVNQVTAANTAIVAGIDQINCLGVGGSANCNFTRGAGAFTETASTFGDFQDALIRKLARETGTAVPEPGSLALLLGGVAGLGLLRRRSRS